MPSIERDEVIEALDRALKARGRGSKSALARELDIDPSTINKILNGERKIKVRELPLIERFMGGILADPDSCPLYGFVAAAGEVVNLTDAALTRRIPIHPAQRGYSQTGAVEVIGESMYPRYKPREIVYFVFGLRPKRGEDAVVEMTDGSAILKEYVIEKTGYVFLREFYPEERQFSIESTKVKALHAVVGRG
jgi:transcriptional regulator with XRE-family HTH domain